MANGGPRSPRFRRSRQDSDGSRTLLGEASKKARQPPGSMRSEPSHARLHLPRGEPRFEGEVGPSPTPRWPEARTPRRATATCSRVREGSQSYAEPSAQGNAPEPMAQGAAGHLSDVRELASFDEGTELGTPCNQIPRDRVLAIMLRNVTDPSRFGVGRLPTSAYLSPSPGATFHEQV